MIRPLMLAAIISLVGAPISAQELVILRAHRHLKTARVLCQADGTA